MSRVDRRFVIDCQPLVAWYVGGRKLFGREPVAIRRSWKVGRYGSSSLAARSASGSKEEGCREDLGIGRRARA